MKHDAIEIPKAAKTGNLEFYELHLCMPVRLRTGSVRPTFSPTQVDKIGEQNSCMYTK